MQTVSEQLTQEIHRSLKNMGLAPLSSDNSASLVGQLQNIAKKENCVRSVIGERPRMGSEGAGGQPCVGCEGAGGAAMRVGCEGAEGGSHGVGASPGPEHRLFQSKMERA